MGSKQQERRRGRQGLPEELRRGLPPQHGLPRIQRPPLGSWHPLGLPQPGTAHLKSCSPEGETLAASCSQQPPSRLSPRTSTPRCCPSTAVACSSPARRIQGCGAPPEGTAPAGWQTAARVRSGSSSAHCLPAGREENAMRPQTAQSLLGTASGEAPPSSRKGDGGQTTSPGSQAAWEANRKLGRAAWRSPVRRRSWQSGEDPPCSQGGRKPEQRETWKADPAEKGPTRMGSPWQPPSFGEGKGGSRSQ